MVTDCGGNVAALVRGTITEHLSSLTVSEIDLLSRHLTAFLEKSVPENSRPNSRPEVSTSLLSTDEQLAIRFAQLVDSRHGDSTTIGFNNEADLEWHRRDRLDYQELMESPFYIRCPLSIVYEDQNYVAFNKPWDYRIDRRRNAAVERPKHAEFDTLAAIFKRMFPAIENVRFCHQLDYATSGLILLAKNHRSAGFVGKQFVARKAQKVYRAILLGRLDGPALARRCAELAGRLPGDGGVTEGVAEGEAVAVISVENTKGFRMELSSTAPAEEHRDEREKRRSQNCETKIRIVQWGTFTFKGFTGDDIDEAVSHTVDVTEVEFRPVTGRRHQLRVTAAALGHPILGDLQYGVPSTAAGKDSDRAQRSATRMYLHSDSLTLRLLPSQVSSSSSLAPIPQRSSSVPPSTTLRASSHDTDFHSDPRITFPIT